VKRADIRREELNSVSFRLLSTLLNVVNMDIYKENPFYDLPFGVRLCSLNVYFFFFYFSTNIGRRYVFSVSHLQVYSR
jgi:hypothetical protein